MYFRSKIWAYLVASFFLTFAPFSYASQEEGANQMRDSIGDVQVQPELFSPISSAVQMILALLCVIALAYLILHKGLGSILKRQTKGNTIKVKERISLDNKNSLYLVEIGEQLMVLSGSERGVNVVIPSLRRNSFNSNEVEQSFSSVKKSFETGSHKT